MFGTDETSAPFMLAVVQCRDDSLLVLFARLFRDVKHINVLSPTPHCGVIPILWIHSLYGSRTHSSTAAT